MMKKERIQYLLLQQAGGNISREELAELDVLLESEQLEEKVEELIVEESVHPLEASAALHKQMFYRIVNTDRPLPVLRKKWYRQWWAAAAILLLFAAGAYFWPQPSPQIPMVQINDVLPGSSKATLTLADGTVVELDSTGSQVIRPGIRQQGDQLLYEAKDNATAQSFNKLSTPRGGQFRIILPDGTHVWLNAASTLRYPTIFSGKERNVEVSGEAYFEVAGNKNMPFHVKINNQAGIEVLGTHFNVNAYRDEAFLRTTLLEGSVRLSRAGSSIILKPGEQGVINPAGGAIRIEKDINTDKVIAWKNGLFNFQDMKLTELMRQLSRWYDIEVMYEGPVPDIEFAGKISRNEKLSTVLQALQESGVHFKIAENKKVIVMP